MVIVMLAGGLGNQLFQYAFGVRLAFDLKTDLKIGLHLLESHLIARVRNYTPRSYELPVFCLDLPVASVLDLSRTLLKAALPISDKATVLYESQQDRILDKSLLQHKQDVISIGYWQSENYFSSVADQLRQKLVFRKPLSAYTQQLATRITQTDQSAFIHIRRGDYVTNSNASQHHGVCTIDYYKHAISHIRERIQNPDFYVFSDDLSWVKQELGPFLKGAIYVESNQGDASWQDMFLMSQCTHAIVANSSFSWWGAWLNPVIDRVVIAPSQWFRENNPVYPNVVPSHWISL